MRSKNPVGAGSGLTGAGALCTWKCKLGDILTPISSKKVVSYSTKIDNKDSFTNSPVEVYINKRPSAVSELLFSVFWLC